MQRAASTVQRQRSSRSCERSSAGRGCAMANAQCACMPATRLHGPNACAAATCLGSPFMQSCMRRRTHWRALTGHLLHRPYEICGAAVHALSACTPSACSSVSLHSLRLHALIVHAAPYAQGHAMMLSPSLPLHHSSASVGKAPSPTSTARPTPPHSKIPPTTERLVAAIARSSEVRRRSVGGPSEIGRLGEAPSAPIGLSHPSRTAWSPTQPCSAHTCTASATHARVLRCARTHQPRDAYTLSMHASPPPHACTHPAVPPSIAGGRLAARWWHASVWLVWLARVASSGLGLSPRPHLHLHAAMGAPTTPVLCEAVTPCR